MKISAILPMFAIGALFATEQNTIVISDSGSGVVSANPEANPVKSSGISIMSAPGSGVVTANASAKPVESAHTYVGVELMPVDGPTRTLFKLPATGGMLVTAISTGSPAAGSLGQGDILLKLDDQLLINRDQLRTLVRARKPGDEVSFTVVRGGRTETVKVKLGELHSVSFSHRINMSDLPGFEEGRAEALARRLDARVRRDMDASGMDAKIMDRATIRVPLEEGEQGFVTIDAANKNASVTTERTVSRPEGKITITTKDGKKSVVVKDKDNKVLAEGELTDELRAKLPSWAKGYVERKAAVNTYGEPSVNEFHGSAQLAPGS